MISPPKPWTMEQIYCAVSVYLEAEEGRRFQSMFSSHAFGPSDVEVFVLDADRRLQSIDDAGRWWSRIKDLIRTQPDIYLAVAEPFAQRGMVLEEVYRLLPGYFDANSLQKALSSARIPSAKTLPPGISNVIGWTAVQINERLRDIKAKLDWNGTTASARQWWMSFERVNADQPALILRIAEELANRQATIAEFFMAYAHSETSNIQANLHYLDYTRLKNLEAPGNENTESEKAENGETTGANDTDRRSTAASQGAYNDSWWNRSYTSSDVAKWTVEQLHERLVRVMRPLGFEAATGSARKWWESLEQKYTHQPAVVLRIAEELSNRRATITEFFIAYAYSDTDNLQAILSYLDYTHLKNEESRQKRLAELNAARTRSTREWFNQLVPLLESEEGLPELSDEDVARLRTMLRDDLSFEVHTRLVAVISAAEERIRLRYSRFAEVHRRIAARKKNERRSK